MIVLKIGNILKIDGQEHILLDHPGDHVVGGDDQIHRDTAVGQLGVHDLVGIVGGVVDLDVGVTLFKFGDNLHRVITAVGNVLAPVIHIQRDLLLGVGLQENVAEAQQQDCCTYTGTDTFECTHCLAVHFAAALTLVPVGPDLDQIHGQHQHKDQTEQQGEHGVDLGLNGLFGVGVDLNGQGYEIQTADEIADDEIVQTHGEGHDGTGNNTGHDLVEGHLEEGLQRCAA